MAKKTVKKEEKKDKVSFEEKREQENLEKLQSDAISKMYKKKVQFDNSKNSKR
jgi:hypothetical protein